MAILDCHVWMDHGWKEQLLAQQNDISGAQSIMAREICDASWHKLLHISHSNQRKRTQLGSNLLSVPKGSEQSVITRPIS